MSEQITNIRTSFGSTEVRHIGTGAPVLVLHGGPGFTHSYLRPHLDFLSERFKLIYFDQLGADGSAFPANKLTFDRIRNHCLEVVRQFFSTNPVTVVAHSWGGLVAMACLEVDQSLEFQGLVVNPLPVTRAEFEAMRAGLFARMPADFLTGILSAETGVLSEVQFDRLLKFYVSPRSAVSISNLVFDMSMYQAVCATLGDFDFTQSLHAFKKCHVLAGADDFIDPLLTSALDKTAASKVTFANCGHFPFLEQPAGFQSWAEQSLLEVQKL
jgi:pimeloyl-ACP methyl ester carboxylesterase